MQGFGFFDDEETEAKENPAIPQENLVLSQEDRDLHASRDMPDVEIQAKAAINTVLLFSKYGQIFGIPVQFVKEVRRDLQLIPLPVSMPLLAGVAAVAGTIVAIAYDEPVFMGYCEKKGSDQREPTFIICEMNDQTLALMVDEAYQVMEVPEDSIRPLAPRNKQIHAPINAISNVEDKSLLFLDVPAIMENISQSQAALGRAVQIHLQTAASTG